MTGLFVKNVSGILGKSRTPYLRRETIYNTLKSMTAGTDTPLHFYRKGEAEIGVKGRGQQVLAARYES